MGGAVKNVSTAIVVTALKDFCITLEISMRLLAESKTSRPLGRKLVENQQFEECT